MTEPTRARLEAVVEKFARWLSEYGETSWDFQTFYASPFGRKAKQLYYRNKMLGTAAVAPIIFCEAFVPSARRFFFIRQRFPIADAHYAMAFASRFQVTGDDADLRRAVHFLEVLLETRCESPTGYAWGYPFAWEGIGGTVPIGTPLITTLPYVYEAFSQVYALDGQEKWRQVMRAIAEHAFHDYRDWETSPKAATAAYTPNPNDKGMVVNASAYRAFLLTKAAIELGDEKYLVPARRNMHFVMEAQNPDGSWPYSVEGKRPFIDHFHTCFVLKALAKIDRLDPASGCRGTIERGVSYYASQLFDEAGIPKPFAKAPRLIVYRRELYDYAESINLMTLLRGQFPELDRRWPTVVGDIVDRWQRPDGSFRSRQLYLGWDDVPMHRWAQAQTFRGLCAWIADDRERERAAPARAGAQQTVGQA
jgi:hypothetical protein